MVSAQAPPSPSKVHTWNCKGGPEGHEKRKGKSHLLLLSFPRRGELKETLKIWFSPAQFLILSMPFREHGAYTCMYGNYDNDDNKY